MTMHTRRAILTTAAAATAVATIPLNTETITPELQTIIADYKAAQVAFDNADLLECEKHKTFGKKMVLVKAFDGASIELGMIGYDEATQEADRTMRKAARLLPQDAREQMLVAFETEKQAFADRLQLAKEQDDARRKAHGLTDAETAASEAYEHERQLFKRLVSFRAVSLVDVQAKAKTIAAIKRDYRLDEDTVDALLQSMVA